MDNSRRRWSVLEWIRHREGEVIPDGAGIGGAQGLKGRRFPERIDPPDRLADQARIRGGDLPYCGTGRDGLDRFAAEPSRVAQDRADQAVEPGGAGREAQRRVEVQVLRRRDGSHGLIRSGRRDGPDRLRNRRNRGTR